MRWFLLLCVLAVCASCEKPQPPKPITDKPGFREPTATEVFNLRSRCAELAVKLDSEYDHAGKELAKVNKSISFLRQDRLSNYNPKTNRCYVELRVMFETDMAAMISLSRSEGPDLQKEARRWLLKYEPDFSERYLYDGQTEEELAWSQKGLKSVAPSATRKGVTADWTEVNSMIDAAMADNR